MINKGGSQPAGQNRPTGQKSGKRLPDEPKPVPIPFIIAGGALVLLLILFLYHSFVNPLLPERAPSVTKVAPLPGFPDTPPYNTKEWQDAYNKGQASFISGVPPRMGPPGGGTPAGAQQPSNPPTR